MKSMDCPEAVCRCAFTVLNALGAEFLEKVYENALAYEIGKRGLNVAQQRLIRVCYANIVVDEYFTDMVVADLIIIELKAVKVFEEAHHARCLNDIKATVVNSACS